MNTEILFDGMTWGELRAFVRMGEHMDDAAEVGIGYDQNGSFEPNSLWVRHA